MFHVLIFTDDDYAGCRPFGDIARAQMFAAGVLTGATLFGGDTCAVFVVPDETPALDEWVGDSAARLRSRDRAIAETIR